MKRWINMLIWVAIVIVVLVVSLHFWYFTRRNEINEEQKTKQMKLERIEKYWMNKIKTTEHNTHILFSLQVDN